MCGRAACTLAPPAFQKAVADSLGQAGGVEDCTNTCPGPGGNPGGGGGAVAAKAGGRSGPPSDYVSQPAYNITPGSDFKVVVPGAVAGSQILRARWGTTVANLGNKLVINARSETLLQKATFRRMRTCIVFLTGYYEWCVEEQRQPYFIHPTPPPQADGDAAAPPLLAVAGLWDETAGAFVLLTRAAYKTIAWCHHRVPVVLETEDDRHHWLQLGSPGVAGGSSELLARLADAAAEYKLSWHPVTRDVGRVGFNTPACVAVAERSERMQPGKKAAAPAQVKGQKTLFDVWAKPAAKRPAAEGGASQAKRVRREATQPTQATQSGQNTQGTEVSEVLQFFGQTTQATEVLDFGVTTPSTLSVTQLVTQSEAQSATQEVTQIEDDDEVISVADSTEDGGDRQEKWWW